MKLPGLIDLSLILILASNTKGQNWTVNISKRNITAQEGKNVTIYCTFTYPQNNYTPNLTVYWKDRNHKSSCDTADKNDQYAFIFHPNDTCVLDEYRGRTKLIGNKNEKNCSLQIQKITKSVQNIYVRIIGKGDQYSFTNERVSIFLEGDQQAINKSDITITQSPTSESSTMDTTKEPSKTANYMAIFVPVAAVLILILVVGIVFCIKHKRSKAFTRQDSGYYANFRGPSSNQANREAYFKKQDNKLPERKAIDEPVYLKAIDEPVYINMEAPQDQMDQSMDHTDSVYANVDYSKE